MRKQIWILAMLGLFGLWACSGDGKDVADGDDAQDGTAGPKGDDGTAGPKGDDGAPGPKGDDGVLPSLTLVIPEVLPEGNADCPLGGIRIVTGVDANGNGALDDDEIDADQTQLLCQTTAGQQVQVRVSEEPPGENCFYGGQKIETGLDDGQGGLTGDIETVYVCQASKFCAGFFTERDVDELLHCTELVGNVEITNTDLETFAMPRLTRIFQGGIYIQDNPSLSHIDLSQLSALNYVGDFVITENAALTSLDLSQLAALDYMDNFVIAENASLTALDLSQLAALEYVSDFVIADNASLTALDLSQLQMVQDVYNFAISDNDALTELDLSQLAVLYYMSYFVIEDNDALTSLDLSGLTQVEYIDSFRVSDNDALTDIDLSQLAVLGVDDHYHWCDFEMSRNAALAELALPALTKIDHARLIIEGNAALAEIALPELEALVGMGYYESRISISHNPSLDTLAFPELVNAERLLVRANSDADNTGLTRIEAPKLEALRHLEISSNAALTSFDFVLLKEVQGEFNISFNPNLPHGDVEDLLTQLNAPPSSTFIPGNLGTP